MCLRRVRSPGPRPSRRAIHRASCGFLACMLAGLLASPLLACGGTGAQTAEALSPRRNTQLSDQCSDYFGRIACRHPVVSDLMGVWGYRNSAGRWVVALASDGCQVQTSTPLAFRRYECEDGLVVFPARAVRMHLVAGRESDYAVVLDEHDEPRVVARRRNGILELSPSFAGRWTPIERLPLSFVCERADLEPILQGSGRPGCLLSHPSGTPMR